MTILQLMADQPLPAVGNERQQDELQEIAAVETLHPGQSPAHERERERLALAMTVDRIPELGVAVPQFATGAQTIRSLPIRP